MIDYDKIINATNFLKNWKETDMKELDGDTISDYAKFILSNHVHINTAIEVLEDKASDIRLKYTD